LTANLDERFPDDRRLLSMYDDPDRGLAPLLAKSAVVDEANGPSIADAPAVSSAAASAAAVYVQPRVLDRALLELHEQLLVLDQDQDKTTPKQSVERIEH